MREHSRGWSPDKVSIKAPSEIKQIVKKSYPQEKNIKKQQSIKQSPLHTLLSQDHLELVLKLDQYSHDK